MKNISLSTKISLCIACFLVGFLLFSTGIFKAPIRPREARRGATLAQIQSHPFFASRPYLGDLETAIKITSLEGGEIVLTSRGQVWVGIRDSTPSKLIRIPIRKHLTREQIISLMLENLDKAM